MQSKANSLSAPYDEQAIRLLKLMQHCAEKAVSQALKFWLLTVGAAPAVTDDTQCIQPEQATLWGLGRVAMNEHPELNCTLIDFQAPLSVEQATQLLLNECIHETGDEAEVLLTENCRHVMRLHKKPLSVLTASDTNEHTDVCLDFNSPGPLKNLYWRRLPEQSLQEDEIEILPAAVGLNFRDVMYAMGLLSDEAVENGFAGASLGMELAGAVVRVGGVVHDFKPGDAVLGFAPACFSTRVITRTTAVSHKPEHWSDAEAATVPTTFFTVYYALQHLAQLQPGERVLIHGASGGVGLAAIQFARYRGAEVFATAGTEEKRAFAKFMGADHVLDSRSLQFAETIKHLTSGTGVDVVLNSISGEAIHKNLSILRPFGRFLELGKRDFYENSKLGLRPFRNNISYFGIDADQLLIERPDLAGRLFSEMMALFQGGVLRPLPHRVFAANRIQEAFRYMQQSSQIGKVVVSFTEADKASLQPVSWGSGSRPRLTLPADASYLVTGGLSGFGLRSACWLADHGAKTLILLSRRGERTPEAQQVIHKLQQRGVQVAVYACDVADASALQAVLTEAHVSLPPLRGIIHAAMVLDDGLLRTMQPDSLRKVLAPKMLGAWNLHHLTQEDALDFMVFYSSVTTYLGNPGQANYVAANMYMESLTHYRRSQGLPAQYVAWGALDDTGYLARHSEIKEALQARLGGEPLTAACALKVLEQLILADQPGVAVIDMDWQVIQRYMPAARSARFSEQQRQAQQTEETNTDQLIELLAGLSPTEAQQTLAKLLVTEVSQILRLPQEKLPVDKSVFALGMDSLMGMELVLAIEERFGVRLPVMALTEGASIQRIAEKIYQTLTQEQAGQTTDAAELHKQTVAAVVKQHGSQLSEAELEQLSQRLAANQALPFIQQDKQASNEH